MVVACGGLAGFRWRVWGGGLLSSRVIVPVEWEVSGGSGRGEGGSTVEVGEHDCLGSGSHGGQL